MLALGAALVTVTLWASAFVGIRDAGRELSAGPLSLGRLLVAAVALGVVVAIRRDALPPRADVPRLVLCGALWLGAYNVLLNAAEQRVDAGTAAMLVNVGPILIALLAGLLLHEPLHRSLLAGYLGLVPTAIGFSTWAYALRRTTAGRMGATTYLVPPIAIVLAWALLDETPPAPGPRRRGALPARGGPRPRRPTARRAPSG